MKSVTGALVCVLLLSACSERNALPPIVTFDATADGTYVDRIENRDTLAESEVCASTLVQPELTRTPVDIILVVDNSGSMEPAIEQVQLGLNGFAEQLFESNLDYRLILLSLKNPRASRYPVCIPEPLAGPNCADSERFFHVSVDMQSSQLIEQVLGTLAQTNGYRAGEGDGSEPWRELLRTDSVKHFVFVTDDNSRTCTNVRPGGGTCVDGRPPLTRLSLEDFPGGRNPFNSRDLGPGILTSEYGRLFADYVVSGIYGWGSETDDAETCTFEGGSSPDASGQTYTFLIARTGGVRAQICDGAEVWTPFFSDVASEVLDQARVACNIAIPPPPAGQVFSPNEVNVRVTSGGDVATVPFVESAERCVLGGWYYDSPSNPTEIILCPTTCDTVQDALVTPDDRLDVAYGCETIIG